ncbi:MAG TPA: tetratricopeptide repeat protein [Blastocatellia bacterium]|nr:tetratricopeptide repeat protein [Blastocatellia bacterium]
MKGNFKRLALLFLLLGVTLPANSQSLDKPIHASARKTDQHKIKEVGDNDSRDGQYWFNRGYEFHQSDRYQQAIEAFAHSIDLGYRQATAMYNIACGFALLNDKENALTWLERAMSLGFDRSDLLRNDSDLDPIRSDTRFQQLLRKFSAVKVEYKSSKDDGNKTSDRYQEAINSFEQLRQASSDDGNQWYKVGSRLMRMREFDRAVFALTQAIEHLRYRNGSAMYNLACAYALKGDRATALEWLEKSINAEYDDTHNLQNDSDIVSLRSDARFKQIEKLSQTLSLSQFNKDSFDGSNYSKQRWAPAIELYESFLRGAPDNGRGWFNLGFALHYSSEHARAIEAFKWAIRLGYRNPTATYNIACGYAMMNRRDEAFEWLDKSVESGFEVSGYVYGDHDLDNLRSDSRFKRFQEMAEDQHEHKKKNEK